MERRQIGLKLVMDKLDLPVTVDSFDDRLILQKAIYLAEASGVRLGYYYRWYLRGPYCPAVAEDGFAVAADSHRALMIPGDGDLTLPLRRSWTAFASSWLALPATA